MDKSLAVKVIVVVLVLIFLLEPFSMTINNWYKGGSAADEAAQYVGTANVNITIYSYGAFLFANGLTDFQKTQVKSSPEVLSVEDLEGGNQRITLRDSAKTKEVYAQFKKMGVQTVSVVQVGLPEEYDLTLENGSVKRVNGGYQQLFMEPVMETGHSASFIIAAETIGNNTNRVLQAKLYYYDAQITGEGNVEGAGKTSYAYSVPWEERDFNTSGLEEEFGKGNVSYSRKDYITFSPTLSAGETLLTKQSYMTFISETSATVYPDFTNRSEVEGNFGAKAQFPPSILTISADEEPGLDFNYTKKIMYNIRFPQEMGGYYLGTNESIALPSERELSANETVNVLMNITATGDFIIGIKDVQIE